MRKPIQICLSCLMIACAGMLPPQRQTYKVKSAEEFLNAIGPDRVIEFESGIFILSDAFDSQLINPYASVTKDAVDYELHIRGVQNLTLRGSAKGETTILAEPTYGNVMVFGASSRISIENLVLGHGPEPGFCLGGVLKFLYCGEVTIANCRLFGSGIEGINAERVNRLTVTQTTIDHCSYNIMTLDNCKSAIFDNCRFTNNTSQISGFINLYESSDVRFVNSLIEQNHSGTTAYLFETTHMVTPVRLVGCKITNNEVIDWRNDPGAMIVSDCQFENNRLPDEDEHYHEE